MAGIGPMMDFCVGLAAIENLAVYRTPGKVMNCLKVFGRKVKTVWSDRYGDSLQVVDSVFSRSGSPAPASGFPVLMPASTGLVLVKPLGFAGPPTLINAMAESSGSSANTTE